jgi:diketogulonate reductase-like aldo/keto reductase
MGNTSSVDATSNAVLEDGKVSALVSEAQLDDDQIVKIKRQLVFKKESGEGGGDLQAKAAELVAVTQHEGFKVPKVRFGRTGLMMPIVTCGGMRVQQTWCPDSAGVLATTKMSGIDNRCQANLIAIIRRALALGINHFETARMYGTSELQYADALATMIESGEVKRADLIIQTKIRPYETDEEFMKTFEQSWKHMSRLGYIDLFSFHGVSSDPWYDLIFGAKGGKGTGEGAKGSSSSSSGSGEAGETAIEGGNNKAAEEGGGCGGNMRCALKLQAQGRIKHIGVSTHGSAAFVRRLIESNSFDYINLHHHFFGSYHASGTSPVSSLASSCSDGQGNASNVRLAKEKKYDMGVFVISPFDKVVGWQGCAFEKIVWSFPISSFLIFI